ncbi:MULTISPECIES: RidA family protein [Mycobacteriaceae]|uniref:RidA family protein n=1 Tax=Mycolicibacterium parafortuitum TaxID=39692 RepID=A0ACC6MCT7_MYCPF|nr:MULTISPECIES: RidA family protein [Mycobacteriaceae]MDZ5084770.1 RidA family protein [Mycolicibacterium parafortuitum]GFM18644.1 endoribonuclease L-PSP [Mycobacterium sp. PO1]GFM22352.1 endoribonuclease L-PSP [Mycobacterium sp. PO2]
MDEVKSVDDVEFFVTPGYGEMLRRERHYSQAVRVGDRVEISGQGGWDDELNFPDSLEDEIARAFENVERTLATAGASWRDVIHLNSYHLASGSDSIFDAHNDAMIAQMRKWMPDHAPIWTETGVAALAAPGMRVEIRVTAILGARP